MRRGVGFDAPAVRAQRGGLAPAPVGGRATVAAQHAGGRFPGGGGGRGGVARGPTRRSSPSTATTLPYVSSDAWSRAVGHLLPSGVGGDAARGAEAIGLVVVDRYVGICSLALLAATGLVFWSNQAVPELQQVSAGAAGLLWADRLLALAAPSRLAGRALMDRLVRFARTLGQYRRHGGLVAGLLALSFVVQVTRVLQAYVFGRGLGIDVAFSYYLAFMPVCILIILLPISIGGLGVAQGVTIALLRPVGVPDEQSFALSTILVLAALLSATPGALLLIRHRMAGARP